MCYISQRLRGEDNAYSNQQIYFSDTFDQAQKKVKLAESRSDLSAESGDDRQTRHTRCQIQPNDDEVTPIAHTNKKCSAKQHDSSSLVQLALTTPPVPVGLQLPAYQTTRSM